MSHTDEQRGIIASEARELLVSAAAGSGKTHTMTHRIVERVASGRLSLDRCLVLTFTEKAAENMRARLAQVLHAKLERERGEGRRYLLEQALLLQRADISTIHAFCARVLEVHGPRLASLDLPYWPDYRARVLEEQRRADLLSRAVDEVLDAAYAEADAAFFALDAERRKDFPAPLIWRLCDRFGDGKGDAALRGLLADFYVFLRSMPHYERWLDEALRNYRACFEDFAGSEVCAFALRRLGLLHARATEALAGVEHHLRGAEPPQFKKERGKNDGETRAYNEAMRGRCLEFIAGLRALGELIAQPASAAQWDAIVACGRGLELPKLTRTRSRDEARRAIVEVLYRCVGELLFCLDGRCDTESYKEHFLFHPLTLFAKDSAALSRELEREMPLLEGLAGLMRALDLRYGKLKQTQGAMDFEDMEHFALALIGLPEVEAYYRGRIDEVYIDEYQDTSSIQEAILSAVAMNRMFMVGDLKQSIYRFRHARPELFGAREGRLRAAGAGGLETLSLNFRSSPAVLRTINGLFEALMRPELAGLDYARGHRLGIPEQPFAEDGAEAALNFLIYADSRAEGSGARRELLAPPAAEGLVVAEEIRRLLESGAVEPQEIAVLSRRHRRLAEVARVLALLGIEYAYPKDQRRCESRALRSLIALLHLLDNPLQDNYLVGVMLHFSPWPRFSVPELLRIRAEFPGGGAGAGGRAAPFYEALHRYGAGGADDGLRARVQRFLDGLDRLRRRCLGLDTDALLRCIYEEQGLLGLVEKEADGPRKVKELRAFAAWAETLERRGRDSLTELVRALNAAEDSVVLPGDNFSSEASGVQLMTFHGSKGLEFDQVFLLGGEDRYETAKFGSSRAQTLAYTQDLGLACRILTEEGEELERSPLMALMQTREDEANFAEYLRLLYVALTRAKRRICLSVRGSALGALGAILAAEDGDSYAPATSRCLEEAARLRRAAGKNMATLLLLALYRNKKLPAERLCAGLEALCAPAEPGESAAAEDFVQGDTAFLFRDAAAALRSGEASGETPPAFAAGGGMPGTEPEAGSELEALWREERRKETPFWAAAYAYPAATRSGLKFSVSEIKRRASLEAELTAAAPPADEAPGAVSGDAATGGHEVSWLRASDALRDLSRSIRPLEDRLDAARGAGDAARRGSLLHLGLRYLRPGDYRGLRPDEAEGKLAAALRAQSERGLFTPDEAEALFAERAALLRYFGSELAGAVARCDAREEGSLIYREIPFTLAMRAGELPDGEAGAEQGAKVLVQGIVDLWYRLEGETVLLDFKSDRIRGSEAEIGAALRARYLTQLRIYARAIERELGTAVDRSLIWLLDAGRAFAIALD